eukprot:Opistho-1_new@105096
MRQPFFLPAGFVGQRTARMASSNTVLRPFCVSAEHSRYLFEPISLAMARPCVYAMGASFFSLSFSIASLSSRRSSLVPTRMMGVWGQWWLTSGCHFALTFSKEAGEMSEKQIRNTSVWGYESGRRRS